jgi:3-deoxy-7-phosphoheptulonate synthase
MTLLALRSKEDVPLVVTALGGPRVGLRVWAEATPPLLSVDLPHARVVELLADVPGVRHVGLKAPVLSTRHLSGDPHVVQVGDFAFGGRAIPVIAGPCSIDTHDRLARVVERVQRDGAGLFRAGAFKGRTNPYAFQGHGLSALDVIARVRSERRMPAVAEVLTPEDVEPLALVCDVLQVGARNMHNTALLKAVGRTSTPVLLKRGFSSTIDEFLCAADYVLSEGNEDVILCERGVRTFEPAVRFSFDVTSLALLKTRTRLPVVVDPSHASGRADLVLPVARAAVAAGADGLLIEVHDAPEVSLSDGEQALTPDAFASLMRDLERMAHAVDRSIARPIVVEREVALVA